MATADALLKPDHGARRKHFIFTDEHDQLRESIRAFVTKELAPHAEEWEETTFPDSVFTRMGELGFLGPLVPRGVRRPGRRLLLQPRARRGDGALELAAAWRWAWRCTPTWPPRRCTCSAPRSRSRRTSCPSIRGEKISCLGITEPDAGSDVAGIKTRAVRDGDEWVINGSKTYITNGHRADYIVLVTKTDPDAGYDGFTLFLVDMDTARRDPREEAREARHARLRHGAAGVPGRARARRGRARPGGQGLLPHHVGAPGRAPDRRGGLRGGGAEVLRQDAPVRERAHGVRPPDRPLPGDPPQVRRHGDEDRGRPPDGLHDGLALHRTASTPCARSRWRSSTPRGWRAR